MSQPGTVETRKEDPRKRILDAALSLFAEAGYHGTSVPQVMARAGVGGGSLYRLFESKEALVNAVFREAKGRLARALREGFDEARPPRVLFDDLWARLATFAREEPVAFHFLELQDHVAYLDGESRQLELSVLAPIYLACLDLQRRGIFRDDAPAETILAFVWGAFVGLVKADRLGYAKLGEAALVAARDACWRAFSTEDASKRRSSPSRRAGRAEKGAERWKRRRT